MVLSEVVWPVRHKSFPNHGNSLADWAHNHLWVKNYLKGFYCGSKNKKKGNTVSIFIYFLLLRGINNLFHHVFPWNWIESSHGKLERLLYHSYDCPIKVSTCTPNSCNATSMLLKTSLKNSCSCATGVWKTCCSHSRDHLESQNLTLDIDLSSIPLSSLFSNPSKLVTSNFSRFHKFHRSITVCIVKK